MSGNVKGRYFGGESTTSGKPFTEGSLNFIVKNAGKISAKSIANILHRSVNSVYAQGRKLGVAQKLKSVK
jgi:hypothetical protein